MKSKLLAFLTTEHMTRVRSRAFLLPLWLRNSDMQHRLELKKPVGCNETVDLRDQVDGLVENGMSCLCISLAPYDYGVNFFLPFYLSIPFWDVAWQRLYRCEILSGDIWGRGECERAVRRSPCSVMLPGPFQGMIPLL